MKNLSILIIITLFTINTYAQKSLFNGKNLKNWDIYLGSPIGGFEDLAKKATPASTFQVVEMNGQKLIRISGDINAALATKAEYANYHLRLEFKWGEKVYGRRNSGLLYHSYGPFGVAFGTWMANIEHQLMHDNLGDTYLMANTYCETKAIKGDDGKTFFFSPEGQFTPFSETDNGRSIKKMKDAEKSLGEWNTVDLYCFGQTAVHVVNGQVVMINNNCSKVENGMKLPLTRGKIQLQSEGGEFFIRKVEIKKIKGIPAEFQK
ncbi:MAG TPA: DUF1080 domain-containing protein [Prolixibacteraceae bacterium]|nr:DUF1080 domain-containing protein [Prolixibacteraceae bacterium]